MVIKAELVFIPMPFMGHIVSMVDLNSNLSVTVLVLKLNHDAKLDAYVHSLTATTTASIKFINLPQPETEKDVTPANFVSNIVETNGPLVKEAVTNLVQLSGSVPDSYTLAGFVLDMFLTVRK